MPRHTLALLALLVVLAGCSSTHEAPSCRGDAFQINPTEQPR